MSHSEEDQKEQEEQENPLESLDPSTAEEIDLTGYHLKSLKYKDEFILNKFKPKKLILRKNLLKNLNELVFDYDYLEELDLYDNRLEAIELVQTTEPTADTSKEANKNYFDLDRFPSLLTLDLSFNILKSISFPSNKTLKNLYLCQNKLQTISLDLPNLDMVELGGNRLSEINVKADLKELYLGKNKIVQMKRFDFLNLKILALQSNKIVKIEGILHLENLKELYLSHNLVEKIEGLPRNLEILDVGTNKIQKLENLKNLLNLKEFWGNNNFFSDWKDVEQELSGLKHLECVYFEGNEIAKDAQYRLKLKLMLKDLKQIDATFVRE